MKIIDKINSTKFLILSILSIFLFSTLFSILSGISWVKPWHLALVYLPSLLAFYLFFKKHYEGILTFLFLLLFSFMIYPTITFYMYENDKNNYEITNDFFYLEKTIAQERLNQRLTIDDLNKIKDFIKNSDIKKTELINLPLPYKFQYKLHYSINNSQTEIIFIKNDSLKTKLVYSNRPNPDRSGNNDIQLILKTLNTEIDYIQRLNKLNFIDNQEIPFSEFWTESIISFSSGHIKPAKNFPKIFNTIQIISLLFLSTILINSVSGELNLKKRKKKKKKKKTRKTVLK